jgi:hypothetical protein
MKDYSTISVPREVKAELDTMRKEREWGEFLLELGKESKRLKSLRAFSKLSDMVSDEELDRIRDSSENFREDFMLR